MLLIAAALAAGSFYADPDQLHVIDQAFVCPEDLPSDQARVEEIGRFDAALNRAVKDLTIERLGEFRVYLLKKHECYVTLENIKRAGH